MGKTKYSRRTWKKQTLSATMSTPRLGANACSLCPNRSIPENLNAHVNDGQTCADVHLQLSMLRYDNAMCAVGQEKYRGLCCNANSSGGFKSTLGFVVGVVVAGAFIKKIFSIRKRRIRQEKSYDSDEVPGTVSFSSRSSRSSSRSGTTDLEMPSSHYVQMNESRINDVLKSPKNNRGKKGRHPSRSRDTYRANAENNDRSSPRSKSRHSSRTRDRPISRSRQRENTETNRSTRDRPMSRSRARSRSRPREVERAVSNSRARSRSRPKDAVRQVSRNRARSRSRPKDNVEKSRDRSRGRGNRDRSRSRSRSRYHVDGTRRHTQVL